MCRRTNTRCKCEFACSRSASWPLRLQCDSTLIECRRFASFACVFAVLFCIPSSHCSNKAVWATPSVTHIAASWMRE